MKVYIASSKKYAGKIQEDIFLRDELRSKKISSKITTLKNIINISKPFDVVILKSIWGYHINHKEFLKQIADLKKKKVKLINDYGFIFWNVDKYKYLKEIESIGIIPTIPLQIKNAKTVSAIRNILARASKKLNAGTIVVKPRISESGYLTFLYDKERRDEIIGAVRNNKHLDFIAQPYRPSIAKGEISIIMINGDPLYGIKRFPGVLSKKSNSIYLNLMTIPRAIRKESATLKKFFLKKFKVLPDICRVDFLANGLRYEILEVELIDPDLFFRYIPEKIKKRAVDVLYNQLIK